MNKAATKKDTRRKKMRKGSNPENREGGKGSGKPARSGTRGRVGGQGFL